ncbi:MAG: amino acid ABC transporter substrate-binding protein [Devosia sp.]|uniref:amino acid ABC transporter substrate-binding protein n=1 Tax=Devosia sp. TaxID=1871048 RepID=UPI001ACE61AC|nr:amino acid ABC transporter substrate-binding protein [Devosia sp.]MBN9308904.1 amino acid ABC transporter substrate-binding protein [Devosia sp.]MBN9314658.1 amino acid ABC transporter substrate-binding protein [Devosia sp.]
MAFSAVGQNLVRIVALLAMLVAAGPTVAQDANKLAPSGPTLQAIRDRGHLICATADPLPGFAQPGADGRWTGFDVDFCRAVAVAIFNDADKMEFVPLSGDSRFAQLQTGSIDLIARNAPWTMRRDTGYGASYVATSFYDGQAIMVPQSLGAVSAYELDDVTVCILDEAEQLANLREFFFGTQATYDEVLYEDREDLVVAYQQGLCNAVSASASFLNAVRRGLPEPAAHRILPERISKDMFGPVIRAGDDQWFHIVQWTLFALIDAEEAGVTSANIKSLAATKTHRIRRLLGLEGAFGPAIGLDHLFISNVIKAVGNYGEIFERNFGPSTGAAVVRGQNALWSNGGLLWAPPIE